MAATIGEKVNYVTRVARTSDGKYLLNNGQTTEYFDISRKDSYATITFNTFSTYSVSGVNGVSTDGYISLVQMVMALCLQRATEIEGGTLLQYMEDLAVNTAQINAITMIEDKLAAKADGKNGVDTAFTSIFSSEERTEFNAYSEQGYGAGTGSSTSYWDRWLVDVAHITGMSETGQTASADYVLDTLSKVESDLDSLNSISQQLLIELQSESARRDQAYDLVTAISKSINSVLMSVANNIR